MTDLRKYKKYNLAVLILFITLFAIYSILNLFFYKDYGVSLWLHNLYNNKFEYANSIKKTKIVMVGGSNVLFSIKGQDIEKELKIPVVNVGSNAGLGLIYILDRAKKDFIKPGDTVLLSLEYNLFNNGIDASDVLFKYVLSYDRDYFNKLSSKQKFAGYMTISTKDLSKSLIVGQEVKKNGLKVVADATYDAKNLNLNGDQLMNIGQKTGDFNKRNVVITDLKVHLNYGKASMKELIKFITWCKNNNVKIIYTFPTVPFHKEYSTPDNEKLRTDLKKFFTENNIPVLNTNEITYMTNDKFYDTGYHLNYVGREIRTAVILRELKKLKIDN